GSRRSLLHPVGAAPVHAHAVTGAVSGDSASRAGPPGRAGSRAWLNAKDSPQGAHEMTDLKVIGVVGAGVMGRGLSQDLAQHGYRVHLIDVDAAILDDAKKSIRRTLRADQMLQRKPGAEGYEAVLARIETSTDLEVLADADFVVENVTEKW